MNVFSLAEVRNKITLVSMLISELTSLDHGSDSPTNLAFPRPQRKR